MKAGVAIYSNNVILLVFQKASKCWSIPKGHTNDNESSSACWRRELNEETGLKYIPCGVIHEKQLFFQGYSITTIKIHNDKLLPQVRPGDHDEIAVARWVSFDELTRLPLNGVTANVVDKLAL